MSVIISQQLCNNKAKLYNIARKLRPIKAPPRHSVLYMRWAILQIVQTAGQEQTGVRMVFRFVHTIDISKQVEEDPTCDLSFALFTLHT